MKFNIVSSATEPDKNSLWLHRDAYGKMVLEHFGGNGWESVGHHYSMIMGDREEDIQTLLHDLYNDDEEEGPLGDIVVLTKAVNDTPSIIAQFDSGTTGYRKWSDGRLEQWGRVNTRAVDTAGTNFSLLQRFTNTNFTLTATVNEQMFAFIYARPTAVNQINIRVNNGNDKSVVGAAVSWKAEGYWK